MKTTGTLSLTHERVDDIPLLLGFMQQLNFPILLERHLGSHHLHRGMSNGWLATVWLVFLLSQSNHRKVSVQDWAHNHAHTLETLLGERLRPVEFGDDRLSIILRRLHDAGAIVAGTCAGAILLSREVRPHQPSLSLLDAVVERNAWGRQVDSFETRVDAPALGESDADIDFILWDMVQNEYINESSDLAEIVQREMAKELDIRNRGVKQAGLYVLKGLAMPGILVETAFLSNPEEERLLQSADFRDRVVEAIASAVRSFQSRYAAPKG